MLTILVVDDELYALKGITQGIDWHDLPINALLEAESVDEAKLHLQTGQVDLVISDIEMPGQNGLDLLKHIRDTSPQTLTIFLTGHARFEYAQKAMHHGCFDYLLKPIDHDDLKNIVRRAHGEIERRREQRAFESMLDKYRLQWRGQLPILIERFWQDALASRTPVSADRLNRQFGLYGLPLAANRPVLPVLLSIEEWKAELDTGDEDIMEYAIRKAAEEIVLADRAGAVIRDRGEANLILLYPDGEGRFDRNDIIRSCGRYVAACSDYFHCRLSCYIGEPATVGNLPGALAKLMQLERANVSRPQSVIDGMSDAIEAQSGSGAASLPAFLEWGLMLEHGNADELGRTIEEALSTMYETTSSRETLELFYHGYLHMLFHAVSRKGMSLYDALTMQDIHDGQLARTPQQMGTWAVRLANKTGAALQERGKDASAVIAKVQAFVQDNLHLELSRDDIAGAVYRNPAYLSRMFRKETGLSLTEYIAQAKIERAKRLLTETNDKISRIAEDVGYTHFSYFAKLFKKMTGLTPQEYRKKYQTLP